MSFSPRNQHINWKEKAIRLIRLWLCICVCMYDDVVVRGWRLFELQLCYRSVVAVEALLLPLSLFILCGFCFGAVCLWFIAVASDLNNAVHMPNARKHTHIYTYPQCKWIHARTYTPANMANECAFFIRNIFELYFIHRRYSYWWPLNLALAVGLWTGVCVRMSESAHGGTLAFMLTHCFDLNICDEKAE